MKVSGAYHGWWVVFCTFVIAVYGWGLGFYGLSLYLVALNKAHGWSPATISSAITFYYVVGAFLVMQAGDIILAFNGIPVRDYEDLIARLVANSQPGDTVTLTIWRDGEQRDLRVTLGERPG